MPIKVISSDATRGCGSTNISALSAQQFVKLFHHNDDRVKAAPVAFLSDLRRLEGTVIDLMAWTMMF